MVYAGQDVGDLSQTGGETNATSCCGVIVIYNNVSCTVIDGLYDIVSGIKK
jgi:hypothetical protein